MDLAYKQHANQARRKNRSSTNLNHLSLAPLTSKMPLTDPDDLPDFVASPLQYNPSYLQGKSAPTTPRLLSHSPARAGSRSRRSSLHATQADVLPKSKSAVHLAGPAGGKHGGSSGSLSPVSARRRRDEPGLGGQHRHDSDWLLRVGALISSETRESKGQAWLVSRASSTSLGGLRDAEEEVFQRERAREKELASRRESRRGSLAAAAAEGLLTSPNSRLGSRSHSRVGSGSLLLRTPLDGPAEGYFGQEHGPTEYMPGPDFVSLDEKLEAIEVDTTQADEATVRRLVKRENAGTGSWVSNLIGWSLFSVEENDEESDTGDGDVSDAEGDEDQLERSPSGRRLQDLSASSEPRFPPPKSDDGGWQDAAWLLSVASRVLL